MNLMEFVKTAIVALVKAQEDPDNQEDFVRALENLEQSGYDLFHTHRHANFRVEIDKRKLALYTLSYTGDTGQGRFDPDNYDITVEKI